MSSDPGDEIREWAVILAFVMAGVGGFATMIADSIGFLYIFGIVGISIALIGVFMADSASKKHKEEIHRRAVIASENVARRERENERIRILKLQNEAVAKERNLDYKGAIEIWDYLGDHAQAKRIRIKMQKSNRVKVEQTVVQGDYVDDRDTIVKDSVVSKSTIGAGGKSKSEELREAKALLDEGIIDEDEFKQMKKEILGK